VVTIIENLGGFWHGWITTLSLALISMAAAFVLGTILTSLRISPSLPLRTLATVYVEVVRNLPLPVLFFVIVFELPQVGIVLPFFTFAVATLAVYYAAFVSDALVSGTNAILPGQFEASRALGFSVPRMFALVVLPQGARNAAPALITVFILLTKGSAVASAFGVSELIGNMEHLGNFFAPDILAILIATCLCYLSITIPAGLLLGRLEHRLRVS